MGISNFDDLGREYVSSSFQQKAGAGYERVELREQGLDISGFTRILKLQWPLIALLTIASFGLATLYSMTATTRFTASSKILINPQPKRVFGADYMPQDGNTNQILIESQTRVIASNSVLSRVVDSENLIADPEFSDSLTPSLAGWLKSLMGIENAPMQFDIEAAKREALRRLQEKLSVKRPSQTYVVEVAVSSRDAEKAALLSRAVANAYITDQAQSQAANTRQISALLQGRLSTLQNRLQEAETKVQRFKARHNIIAAEGSLVNERHLSRLNDELLAARNRLSQAQAKADKVSLLVSQGATPDNFGEAINSRVIAGLRQQYATSARTVAQLSTTLGARHPRLKAATARMNRSKKLINAELTRIASSMRANVDVEKKRMRSLEKRLERSRGVTASTNVAKVELAGLEREANAARAVYERVLSRARESNAQEKINLIDARVISYASAPLWASWPKKKIILPLALLLGLGLGLAAALLNDYRQDRFVSNRDMEEALGLRTLGTIPNLVKGRFHALGGLLGNKVGTGNAQSSYYRLYVELSKVGSSYATAILGLVRNLSRVKGLEGSQSIMMVSSNQNEGSSSIAWSTAISAAMQKRNVLLIDGDGGNGELAQTLAPGNDNALRAVLSGDAKLADLIVDDKDLGLSFLPIVSAGQRQAINWGDYQTVLSQLPEISKNYDLVIVDGGAILDAGLAHLLVDVVDGVALVVRSDETSRQTVFEAMRSLDVPANKMRGVIVSTV
ncbi:MAG: exopolysaccharide transport family protein, partial [Hyphomicrobiaceae bacterium]|nr:exopolysaccharide transport family protein [Hyphomicrobiaceae bacterium]